MIRLFKQSENRTIEVLDKVWDFTTDFENKGTTEKWFENFPEKHTAITVPCSWSTEFGLENYTGIAWYHTVFFTQKPNVKLVFGAVHNNCSVYLDGKKITEHIGGHSEFSVICKSIAVGEHDLVLKVDNETSETDSVPLQRVDWYNHGGIMKSVEVHQFDQALIDTIKIEYDLDVCAKKAKVRFVVDYLAEDALMGKEACLFLNQECVKSAVIEKTGSASLIFDDIVLDAVKLWDMESPYLYYFHVRLGDDDLTERTGFRKIEIREKNFYLNDRKIMLKGINRHEEHPDYGFAVPFKIIKKDIDIIRNLGCNIIRGSHYPNAKITLDYLDEIGMLFWEEIPLWGYPENALQSEAVIQIASEMHHAMIRRDYNHPSIIIWGLHNEVATETKAAYDLSEKFIKIIRAYDAQRLLTFATNKPLKDICLGLVDFIAVNKYIGWYEGKMSDWNQFFEDFHAYLEKNHWDNKPLVMSEFGAGGIYGEVSFDSLTWTENNQCERLEYMLKLFLEREDIAGMFLWQYCDLRTGDAMRLSRPRSFNNKGLVNEYRKPKMAYFAVKKLYENA